MDSAALTALVMDIINNPVTPILGTAIVTKTGEDIYDKGKEQAKHLLEIIRARFAKEPDGNKATKALENYVEDPEDYKFVFEKKLFNLIEIDPTFADNLYEIIQSGPRQVLTVEEEAEARRIRMTNTTGIGNQEIKGGKRSKIEDVEMNIKHE